MKAILKSDALFILFAIFLTLGFTYLLAPITLVSDSSSVGFSFVIALVIMIFIWVIAFAISFAILKRFKLPDPSSNLIILCTLAIFSVPISSVVIFATPIRTFLTAQIISQKMEVSIIKFDGWYQEGQYVYDLVIENNSKTSGRDFKIDVYGIADGKEVYLDTSYAPWLQLGQSSFQGKTNFLPFEEKPQFQTFKILLRIGPTKKAIYIDESE